MLLSGIRNAERKEWKDITRQNHLYISHTRRALNNFSHPCTESGRKKERRKRPVFIRWPRTLRSPSNNVRSGAGFINSQGRQVTIFLIFLSRIEHFLFKGASRENSLAFLSKVQSRNSTGIYVVAPVSNTNPALIKKK